MPTRPPETTPAPTEHTEGPEQTGVDPRFVRAQARIGRAILGEQRFPRPVDPDEPFVEDFDPEVVDDIVSAAKRAVALAEFGRLLGAGTPYDEALVATVRALAAANERPAARALVLGLDHQLGTHLTSLGFGQVLFSTADFPRAWEFLREVPTDDLARLLPVEAVTCALAVASPESLAVAVDLAGRTVSYDVPTLVELAGRFLVTGHHDLAVALVAEARTRDLAGVDVFHVDSLANLARWVDPRHVAPATGVVVGVIDYHQPDYERASRNVGDYIQTLAMLGNLARFQRARFTGAEGLGELMTQLQGRVRPDLRLDGGDADVTVVPVSRDYSAGDPLPEQTWTLAFGWHMHSNFRLGFALPYHPRVNPVFVAFHVNREAILTPDAVAYLQAHGPVGCRDWTTVYLLLSAGVDAFFTGCLTSTVDAVFPDVSEVNANAGRRVGAVDITRAQLRRIKRPTEIVTHGGDEHRLADLAAGVRAASELLDTYQQRYSRIVTSRLHSYLPATSLGLEVRFKPSVAGDVRFDGLYGMEPGNAPFTTMRDGIRELIVDTFDLILSGSDRETVYAHWREATAARVEEARGRLSAPTRVTPPDLGLDEILEGVRADTHVHGPAAERSAVEVAISVDDRLAAMLPVTVESMLANASGPVRLWVTTRGLGAAYRSWFSAQFPDLPINFLGMDHVDDGELRRLAPHLTGAATDLLLLAELLPDLDRVTYLGLDTIVEGDICELASLDLAGHPLAARSTSESGAGRWRDAGDLLPPEPSAELRRLMSARHAFDFRVFDAGVLVLDLDRLRADRFTPDLVPLLAGSFGLDAQDTLNAYAGADRLELEPRWNAWPGIERVEGPGIVHFADPAKPWGEEVVPEGDRYHRYAGQFAGRAQARPEQVQE